MEVNGILPNGLPVEQEPRVNLRRRRRRRTRRKKKSGMQMPDVAADMNRVYCHHIRHDFQFFETIAKGRFGTIQRAEYDLGRRKISLAIKFPDYQNTLRSKKVSGYGKLDKWEAELKTLNEVNRELQIIQRVHQTPTVITDNVIRAASNSTLFHVPYIVLEYGHMDLEAVINNQRFVFTSEQIRTLSNHLLNGVGALSAKGITHEKLQPGHLVLSEYGYLKIADLSPIYAAFSGAKDPDEDVRCIHYRAPEILFGSISSAKTDIWSVGCIIGEMFLREPVFEGKNLNDQIRKIWHYSGGFELDWYQQTKKYNELKDIWNEGPEDPCLSERFKPTMRNSAAGDTRGLEFIKYLLDVDFNTRPTAEQALEQRWVSVNVKPNVRFLVQNFEGPRYKYHMPKDSDDDEDVEDEEGEEESERME